VGSRPVHSLHGLSSSPASARISSAFVRMPLYSNIGQQRDVLIFVLPIRTRLQRETIFLEQLIELGSCGRGLFAGGRRIDYPRPILQSLQVHR